MSSESSPAPLPPESVPNFVVLPPAGQAQPAAASRGPQSMPPPAPITVEMTPVPGPGLSASPFPPAVPVEGAAAPAPGTGTAGGEATRQLPPSLQALMKNPIVLAGGAVLAGVVVSRFMATPAAKKLAKDLALEALKQLRPMAGTAAGAAGTAAAGSLLEKGVEKYGPQIADYAKKLLADMLRKKE